jgi:hypothetical protein
MKYSLALLCVSLAFSNSVRSQASTDGSSAGSNLDVPSDIEPDFSNCTSSEFEEYAKRIGPSAKECANKIETTLDFTFTSSITDFVLNVCSTCPEYIKALSTIDPPSCVDAESKSKIKEVTKICDTAPSMQGVASVSGSDDGTAFVANNSENSNNSDNLDNSNNSDNSTVIVPPEEPVSSATTVSGAMIATVATVIAAINIY